MICAFQKVRLGDSIASRCRNCGRVVRKATGVIVASCSNSPSLVDMAVAGTPEINLTLPPPVPTHGVGTELKKLLAGWPFYITASLDCSCNARARLMDERGIEWCEANIDEIVGWLREEATKRGLPFVDMAGRMLVKRAIKNARRHPTPSGPASA